MVMNLGDLVLRPLRCFLKLLLFVPSLLGERLVTQRGGCRSYGEYQQYLKQKSTFSLTVLVPN